MVAVLWRYRGVMLVVWSRCEVISVLKTKVFGARFTLYYFCVLIEKLINS